MKNDESLTLDEILEEYLDMYIILKVELKGYSLVHVSESSTEIATHYKKLKKDSKNQYVLVKGGSKYITI